MAKELKLSKHSDDPLKIKIRGGKLIISMGIERLHEEYTGFTITDIRGYAKYVIYKLQEDNEIGETLITKLFDKVKEELYDDGCEYLDEERKDAE